MKRIAVTGATGYIGGRLVPRLLDAGYAVRCLVRSPRKLQDRSWSANRNVQVVEADLGDAQSLTESLTGCDAAFFLVHSMNSASAEYAKRDLQLATAFARASKRAGVRRIIYLGGLGETGPGLSEHLTSRRQVEKALASAGVPVTVLRAAMIIGSGSASFEILRYLVERLPVMVTPKWVRTPCQPIAVRNVIGYLVGVLSSPETAAHIRHRRPGGSELPANHANHGGRTRPAEAPGDPRAGADAAAELYWIHLVTPLGHSIAKPLAEGLRNPVVCREDHITHIIPQKLLTVRESVAAARGKIAEDAVETSWTMAGEVAGTIPGDPKWAGGTVFHDIRRVHIAAPPAAVFKAVCLLGGDHGWYSAAWLWRIRGWMDVLAGGPGLRRGRLHPETLAYGEPLDFWRVVGIEQDRSLTLRAEMKLPGEALLEFCVTPDGDGVSELEQRPLFKPRGLLGILYWYGVLPFHGFVFSGMLTGIITKALEIARDSRNISNQLVDTK